MSMNRDGLAAAYEAVVRKNKLLAMQAQMMEDWQRLQQKLAALKSVLDKEEQDVSRLENSGIAAMFYTVLGTRRERIIKEREEALAARLKHDQAVSELEDMRRRLEALAAELKTLDGCEAHYAQLFEEKKQRLIAEHSQTGLRILELLDGIGRANANQKEIGEAKMAGEAALARLDSAMESLRKAEGWGTYDMLGGGLIASMVKHDHIDAATQSVSWAQTELNRFRAELADVNISGDIVIQVGDFTRFADFFFDGLIADWYVQGAIQQSMDGVGSARADVIGALTRLHHLQCDGQTTVRQMQAELEALVVHENQKNGG